jgi:hypothetical protein
MSQAQSPLCADFAGEWHNKWDVDIQLTVRGDCTYLYSVEYGFLKERGDGTASLYKGSLIIPTPGFGKGENDGFTLKRQENMLRGRSRYYGIGYDVEFLPGKGKSISSR